MSYEYDPTRGVLVLRRWRVTRPTRGKGWIITLACLLGLLWALGRYQGIH